ncbi:MAG: homoserine dehydrogenase [Actinobacteria bacterium RBG_19FT_COMBO_54_7]|uniref:Homoserine dehydrogenase n=1 Tax=Candidatus Solincola sediminis TaxID=1797199 RepID=A0A1F2WF39_9ACTN|nr:MAG: homoserine dehydrogenase [Candidatus Solincola sediminis]OFW57846.1 MAG: homoserine dehydrogenase [Candidatus Solincola sediminis]OFW68355.1 MAG: homoserine dehydrogenase [Actinobacteria bacterium RBG_19FT_COMBO_54_7]
MARRIERIRLGQIGCGTVGSGVVRILRDNKNDIKIRTGCEIVLEKIAVRDFSDPRYVEVGEEMLTTDAMSVISDPDLDVIIEVIGGIEPARTFILEAITRGKHVVTANKALMSSHGGEILAAAEERGVDVAYEASVGGGIPILLPLKNSLAGNLISQILGIVNGTTNYILTRMTEEGINFSQALAKAQSLGLAESDPSNDIEGRDAAAKLAILASMAFNSRVTIEDVYTEGITSITSEDISFAADLGYVIKLLAIAKNKPDGISVRVHPTMISEDHPLASVRDENNAIFVHGNAAGELMFYGKGAGSLPAASAVVGDVIGISRNMLRGGHMVGCTCFYEKRIKDMKDVVSRYFMIFEVPDKPGVLARIAGVFGENQVSINSVIQHGMASQARLVLITHAVREESIRATIAGLEKLEEINRIASLIRVESNGAEGEDE